MPTWNKRDLDRWRQVDDILEFLDRAIPWAIAILLALGPIIAGILAMAAGGE